MLTVDDFLGVSRTVREVRTMLAVAAKEEATVLICGETGTGKELAARVIHDQSDRSKEPWVVANCAAVPEGLVESEFFGHGKGAFTGASQQEEGLFQAAHRGTVFLDEIGDMGYLLQSRLLRFVSDARFCEREVKMIGKAKSSLVDVRVVAATNQNLKSLVAEKKFRNDLYHRLNALRIDLPPLRERPEDIPILVEAYLGDRATASSDALKLLANYAWPGNVRELHNVLLRALLVAKEASGEISSSHLRFDEDPSGKSVHAFPGDLLAKETPAHLRDLIFGDAPIPSDLSISDVRREVVGIVEARLMHKAHAQCGYKKKAASRLLNVSYRTFLSKWHQQKALAIARAASEPKALARGATNRA